MNRLILLLVAFASTGAVAQTTAIVGGRVHTMGPAGTLENATVLIENGVIVAVGAAVAAPPGATVINAAGKVVTPGLFSPLGNLGLVEVGFSAGPVDAVQRGQQFTAGFDVADAFNPRSTLIAVNRIEGVTRAAITPEGQGEESHVLSGLGALVNLGDGTAGIDKRAAVLVASLGEAGGGSAGETRTGALLVLRNALDEALDYRAHKDEYERGQRRPYVHGVADLEALQGVLSGDVPLLANVHRASDIETLLRLAGEYRIRVIVSGGAEAWLVADSLATAGIPVILEPTTNLPGDFDQLNARRDAATLLATAGVQIAFAGPQSHTHNARNITQSAGNAVSEGLSWNEALRAITRVPAEIYGIADRVGSLEPGKDGDVVIWPADPLELTTYPERVFIRGVAIPMQSRQTLLRDRYLQMNSDRPPAFRPATQ
ncbi:MAG: amidohydrolase family protein [Gammaproteobacteria bacterium]|nr:amidohydrolase family protein [Gammaproteobacteria bacterium]MDH4254019.1 amidohydrolase family protein [Gammaproteobacteria bacterium]MDH5310318.1 amidohydrolase family protein [Gammaproteobacteria bacterium]